MTRYKSCPQGLLMKNMMTKIVIVNLLLIERTLFHPKHQKTEF